MIRLSKSSISQNEINKVQEVLKKEFLGMGEYVQKFENQLSKFFNNDVVCVSSGTSALHLSLQALGIEKHDEVIVPSVTYVASFQAITASGATPVPCDINEKNLLMDLVDLEKKINEKTKVIMPVHYVGDPGNIDKLYKIAEKYNLRVIEDAAHAFGSYFRGKKVGSFGDIICFSFDGIKNITSGEGGCVVSSDKNIIKKVMDSRLLGVTKDSDKRYKNSRSWSFDVLNQGWRYHMSNIMAGIGLEQLKRFESFKFKRQNLAKYYDSKLGSFKNLKIIQRNYDKIVPHIYVIVLNENIDRNKLIEKLNVDKIQVGIHYYPNHLLTFYKNKIELPNTEKFYRRMLTLPLHYDLTITNINFIVKSLKVHLNE